jgi:L-ascorbate metabolism protein UlaG (beta-lactamase superfamily)
MRPSDLFWSPTELGARPGAGVEVRWLGTAGFSISFGGHVLLVDPYLTRASLARCAFGRVASDRAAVARHVPCADAILVGHTHFDHALDVPAIALHTGAKVFGSRSMETLCRAAGVPAERVEAIEPGSAGVVREVGPFRVRFLPSAHSRFALGRVPFPGEIADCDQVPTRVEGYRCGSVLRFEIAVGGKRLVHLGSADLADDAAPCEADLLLLCVAGWTTTERLPERALRAASPGAVLLSHWDDFFRPLERAVRALPAMRMPGLVDALAGASKEPKVGALPLLGAIWV